MAEDRSETDLTDAAKKLGHAGGVVGGPARARKLSQEARSSIARKAAKARWAKENWLRKKPSDKLKENPHLRKKKK